MPSQAQTNVTENELIQRSTAPRVTKEYLESLILSEVYFTAADAVPKDQMYQVDEFDKLGMLTFCVLTLKNGFTAQGSSACASRDNFKADIGERIAKQDAINKIWPLLGYELRTKLALVESLPPIAGRIAELPGASTYVGTKVIRAAPMNRGEMLKLRGWQLPENESMEDEGYLVEYTEKENTNVDGFVGYVSWSPKAVFENAYVDMGKSAEGTKATTFLERMHAEMTDLHAKCKKLTDFKATDKFMELSTFERNQLDEQSTAMHRYLTILVSRISFYTTKVG